MACESCASIDVRIWHREGRLHPGQCFPYSWTYGGQPLASITVWTEAHAIVLMFRARWSEDGEWKSVEQRVPITWTPCHLGGSRAWFRCNVCSNGHDKIALDQSANAMWIPEIAPPGLLGGGEMRHFESVHNADRFVTEELPFEVRATAWITADAGGVAIRKDRGDLPRAERRGRTMMRLSRSTMEQINDDRSIWPHGH